MTTQLTEEETDIDDLREDLTCEIHVLNRILKGLGCDLSHIPDFLKETRALAIAESKLTRFQNYGSRSPACRK
jgi:hypothetical protein